MAEGILGDIVGGEEDQAEIEAPEAPGTAEAFAAAIAAIASRQDPAVARKTEIFLEKQAKLLETQNKHLKDEHALRLSHLRLQSALMRGQRFGQAIRLTLQGIAVLVAAAIALGFAVFLHDALNSRSVVIDSFDISPTLAANNLTGRIVASEVVDQLTRIQAATRSADTKRDIADAWSNEINIELPETGLSIGAIQQLLKSRFGHDQHIGGDLVKKDPAGLVMAIRGPGIMPMKFSDEKGDLGLLTAKAAEYVYSQSQPALWAIYLVESSRFQEAIEFCQTKFGSSPKSVQPLLLSDWAEAIVKSGGESLQAVALLQQAIAIDPHYWDAYNTLSGVLEGLGREEDDWKVGQQLRKAAGGRPGLAPETAYSGPDVISWNIPEQLAAFSSDIDASSGAGTFTFATGPIIAEIYAEMHDPAAAELALLMTKPEPNDPTAVALTHAARGMLATEVGDPAKAQNEWGAFLADYSNPTVAWASYGLNCWVASAEEAVGHPDKADVILNTAGTFVDCYRIRADILDGRGDWKGAQEWYKRSVDLAPDLPAGYYSWGVALFRHGDLVGAVSKLQDANKRGPHWADPLKAWGDSLVKGGNAKEAIAKYDEALKYAPNWAALKNVREAGTKLVAVQSRN
jgi:tetratricopeptide (TPR) repeat protein